MGIVHEYHCQLEWHGSTIGGFENYDREHRGNCPPSAAMLQLSSDPAFRGDPGLLNPEQLLLMAASSCQMLSFLAFAARARINVVSYSDQADAIMPEDDKPIRITKMRLRPRITVAGENDSQRVRHWIARAHEACFIANSVNSEIEIEPQIEIRAAVGRDDSTA
jgi:organic hydroperoxide reductase OsmC/OhrA